MHCYFKICARSRYMCGSCTLPAPPSISLSPDRHPTRCCILPPSHPPPKPNRRLQPSEAISYAQKHLAPYAKDQMKELQKVVACLAFGPSTAHPRYRPYFSEEQWAALVREFQSDLFRLNSMPRHPLLTIHLQVGWIAHWLSQHLWSRSSDLC